MCAYSRKPKNIGVSLRFDLLPQSSCRTSRLWGVSRTLEIDVEPTKTFTSTALTPTFVHRSGRNGVSVRNTPSEYDTKDTEPNTLDCIDNLQSAPWARCSYVISHSTRLCWGRFPPHKFHSTFSLPLFLVEILRRSGL